MKNEIQKMPSSGMEGFEKEQLEVLQQAGIIPVGVPVANVKLFAKICAESGLSPFTHDICLVPFNNKQTGKKDYCAITEIAGYRKIADRSGVYAGMDAPKFDERANGSFMTLADIIAKHGPNGHPEMTCSVTVYKIVAGLRVGFTKVVMLKDFDSNRDFWAWKKMHMIQKVAESHSLRAAFGEKFPALYVREEMAAFEGETIGETENIETILNGPPPVLSDSDVEVLDAIQSQMDGCNTKEEMVKFWSSNPQWHGSEHFSLMVQELYMVKILPLIDDPAEIKAMWTANRQWWDVKPVHPVALRIQEMCIQRGQFLTKKAATDETNK